MPPWPNTIENLVADFPRMAAALTEIDITPLRGDGERVGLLKWADPLSRLDPIVTDLVDPITIALGAGRVLLLRILLRGVIHESTPCVPPGANCPYQCT